MIDLEELEKKGGKKKRKKKGIEYSDKGVEQSYISYSYVVYRMAGWLEI